MYDGTGRILNAHFDCTLNFTRNLLLNNKRLEKLVENNRQPQPLQKIAHQPKIPHHPLAPPMTPVALPMTPLAPLMTPLAPPMTSLALPMTPVALPMTPVAPPQDTVSLPQDTVSLPQDTVEPSRDTMAPPPVEPPRDTVSLPQDTVEPPRDTMAPPPVEPPRDTVAPELERLASGNAEHEVAISLLRQMLAQLTHKTESEIKEIRKQVHSESAALCALLDASRAQINSCSARLADIESCGPRVDRSIVRSKATPPGVSGLVVLLPVPSPKFSHYQKLSIKFMTTFSPGEAGAGIILKCNGGEDNECIILETDIASNVTTHPVPGTWFLEGIITNSFTGLDFSVECGSWSGTRALPFTELHTVELYASSNVEGAIVVLETKIYPAKKVMWVNHNNTDSARKS